VHTATRLAALLPLASLLAVESAGATEVPDVGGKSLLIDITNTSIIDYHFNNRNDSGPAGTITSQDDDFYGEWLDRLNVQASWWRLRLGLRLDTALYYHTPNADTVAALVADQKLLIDEAAKKNGTPPELYPLAENTYATAFYEDLHTRYLRTIYPTKLFLGYTQPGVDVTVGDFYVQLGRGLVFSARKIDELGVDTTVRGVKAAADHDFGPVQLSGTIFAGQMNPLRVDEPSGRRLNGAGSPLFFGFPQDSPLQTYQITEPSLNSQNMYVPSKVVSVVEPASPTYLEDTAVGGRLELGTKYVQFAANTAVLLRKPATYATTDPSRAHNQILNTSGSINVPSIAQHGDLYLEVAGQQMRDGLAGEPDLSGYAVYGSGTITGGPVSVSLELKHYRNYFPLSANVNTITASEFSLLTYSQPPTVEPIYNEVISGGAPDVCITGGRARLDYRFNHELSAYAWLGRYTSWTEIPGLNLSNGCEISAQNQTNTWDTAAGFDLGFEEGKSHVKAWVGEHVSDDVAPHAGVELPENVEIYPFYHEGYLRYDVVFHLGGPFSLQMQGFHRHRYEPLSFVHAWMEGENYTALQWSPHLSAVFGFEYLTQDLCQPFRPGTLSEPARPATDVCKYFNGGVTWRSHGSGTGGPTQRAFEQVFDTVRAFVGQTRPAVRCVSGVCRTFPAFEGARLEITSRF
jgi:Family of unknown function (DUF6029)